MARSERPRLQKGPDGDLLCFVAALLLLAALLAQQAIALPERIVLPSDAIPSERAAAELLARELHALTGLEARIADEISPGPALFVGRSAELDRRHPGTDWTSLGGEGFVLE